MFSHAISGVNGHPPLGCSLAASMYPSVSPGKDQANACSSGHHWLEPTSIPSLLKLLMKTTPVAFRLVT